MTTRTAPGRDADAFAVADRLIAAIEANDVDGLRAVYADDIVVWRNTDGQTLVGEQAVQSTAGMRAAVPSVRFEVTERQRTERGFVQQEVLHIDFAPDQRLSLAIAVIADVADGRITRMHEYSIVPPQA